MTLLPQEPVVFLKAEVFVNPFEEAEAQVAKERAEASGAAKPGECTRGP